MTKIYRDQEGTDEPWNQPGVDQVIPSITVSSLRTLVGEASPSAWGGITGDLADQTDLHAVLSGLIESGEFIFFLEDEADPIIADYKKMDNPAQLEAEAYVTQSSVSEGALVQAWVTDAGLPGTAFIPDGAWQFHINAYKTGGTKEVRLYNEVYKRDLGGTETLLGTTANSIPLTGVEAILPAFNIYIPAVTLLATDRIVTKTRIRLVGGGSNPTSVTVGYSGTTAARLSIPTQAVDVTQFVRGEATTTSVGGVELATDAEAIAGTDPARAITPASLHATLVALGLIE